MAELISAKMVLQTMCRNKDCPRRRRLSVVVGLELDAEQQEVRLKLAERHWLGDLGGNEPSWSWTAAPQWEHRTEQASTGLHCERARQAAGTRRADFEGT